MKILLAGSLLLVTTLIAADYAAPADPAKHGTPSARTKPTSQSKPVAPGGKITVLNPAATNLMVTRLPLSPRLSNLSGKAIYMVDIGWGGPEAGYDVLQVISKWFAQNMPTVKTVIVRKKGSYSTDDPDLWKEIKANGQAAILGLSC